ncbi:Peroxiredoxin DOT5 [Penicillium rolfsii]|nr:Peroxiredoxin DOT5 [Penicillium rolfsii]
MVELRKRKAPAPPPVVEKKSKPAPKPKAADPPKEATQEVSKPTVPAVGDIIDLDTFGGEIETNDGTKTTLKKLVEESKSGVVLFTYPKASTPGCTKQVCLFRDNYTHLTSTGLAIYGLSADSPKANTTFKTKQNLSYSLLCNPSATLIGAIGFKKAPKGTTRGVFAVDKKGKVLLREAGGPDATVDAVQKLVAQDPAKGEAKEEAGDDAEAK